VRASKGSICESARRGSCTAFPDNRGHPAQIIQGRFTAPFLLLQNHPRIIIMATPKAKGQAKTLKGENYKPARTKLTLKQEAFVHAYLETGNASEAYRRAYNASKMKPETIRVKAAELLRNGNVSVRLDEIQSKVKRMAEDRYLVTEDRVIAELAKLAFANMGDYIKVDEDAANVSLDFSAIDTAKFAAIGEIVIEDIETGARTGKRTKFKLLDKRGALVDLGRHLGMFKDRLDVNLTGGDGMSGMLAAARGQTNGANATAA
jgi:phage terminase small subunit